MLPTVLPLRRRRNRSRGARDRRRPTVRCLERLEQRALLAMFAVTNTADSGPGSLREAIELANATPNAPASVPDIITFEIPGAGVHTIQPLSGLPVISDRVVIDGYSQPGSQVNTRPDGNNAVLLIELDMQLTGGLSLETQGSTIRGLVVNRSRNFGIRVIGSGNVIEGNFIGTDPTGALPRGNTDEGILALPWGGVASDSNRIGTNGDGLGDAGERNLISANRHGVRINYGADNVVAGNYIGTDASGTAALGNLQYGVFVDATGSTVRLNNRIGTSADGTADASERNIISGNGWAGIGLAAYSTVIAGNYIGTDVSGQFALGNTEGILVGPWAPLTRIGTDGNGVNDEAERNVISGNSVAGIHLESAENVVAGNYIGSDSSGTSPLGNGSSGILLRGARNRIGTNSDGLADEAERNLISGNGGGGIQIYFFASDNVVAGNFIGTDVTGTQALAPGNGYGVYIAAASSNRIGTDGDGHGDAAERNIISGNYAGIIIRGGSTFNEVAGNFIGTDVSGMVRLKNEQGIFIYEGSSDNRIGTNGDGIADEAERNLISGNYQAVTIGSAGSDRNVVAGNYVGPDVTGAHSLGYGTGVTIFDGPQDNRIERNVISGFDVAGVFIANINNVDAATDRNIVTDNYIGTDATGTLPLGNYRSGVEIQGKVRDNRVERNVIAANLGSGIALVDYNADGQGPERTVIADNFIGANAAGMSVPGLGNGVGVGMIGPGNNFNRIERNVIVASTSYGVVITGTDNVLLGNSIGIDASGAAAGNGNGVLVARTGNVIGDVGPGLGNTIAHSAGFGVAVRFNDSAGNSIRGNSIHDNVGLGIDLGPDGVTSNDPLDADTGPNGFQNFPSVMLQRGGPTTQVSGTLDSAPNASFTIDFYANAAADPSGYSEGQRWLGYTVVTTDAAGHASFNVTLAASTALGEWITATATGAEGTSEFSHAEVITTVVQPVDIDVLQDSVNVGEQGVIAVAILTTADFDAAWVNVATVRFAGAAAVRSAFEDIDHDGDLDLVLHFRVQDTALQSIYEQLLLDDADEDGVLDSTRQVAQVTLTGETLDGYVIEGSDQVTLFLAGKKLRDLLKLLFGA